MSRIYTRGGDAGETSLGDGTRTVKSNERVALYGEVDELNSWLGLAVALIAHPTGSDGQAGGEARSLSSLAENLAHRQRDLLAIGSILADPQRSRELAAATSETLPFAADDLEARIDAWSADLPPLKAFILPGGIEVAAALHIARTVCRRVERKAVALDQQHAVPAGVLTYLNRLSDYLFVAARWANQALGGADLVWSPPPAPAEDPGP